MVLNLGKSLGWTTIHEHDSGLKEVVVRYGYNDYTIEYMHENFAFMKPTISRLFFMAYKFREFDSKLIDIEDSFPYQVQLTPERALAILEKDNIESVYFLFTV